MNAVAFAYHDIGVAGLEALKKNNFHIKAVFSHENDPDENCWFASVADWAERNGIEVFCPVHINKPEWINKIAGFAPDVIFSFYYRYMLCEKILNIPNQGAFNLHGSLLPAYRGRCPVNWVLLNGEAETGVTLHHMIMQADAGDIVAQRAIKIAFTDTAFTLHKKLCRETVLLLSEALPLIKAGTAPRIPQNLEAGSYFGGRRPEDGKIDWHWPVLRIYNLIRAVTDPYPGAFSFLPDGKKLFIWWGEPQEDSASNFMPGRFEIDDAFVYIWADKGRLKLTDIETDGKRMRDAEILSFFKIEMKGVVLR